MSRTDSNSEIHKKWHKRNTIVHILIMTFGVSAWIGVNGIFIQLPLLVNSLPEGWGLAAYLTIAIQAANIAPVIYSLLHKFSVKINQSKCIFVMLVIGCLAMLLMAFFYNKTSIIVGKEHSTALFLLTFIIAMISCSSSVLFMPYLQNFKEIYLVSYFVGEGLSGVMPSIVSLVQGMSKNPECNNGTDTTNISDSDLPTFSPKYYFLFIFVCLLLSLLAFLLLENLSYIKKEKVSPQSLDNNSTKDDIFQIKLDVQGCYCQKYALTSSEGLTAECEVLQQHVCMDDYLKTDIEKLSKKYYLQDDSRLTYETLYLFILLGVICLLSHGVLPGLQPYSSLSYGNVTYHLSVTFSQIANPTACFLALWYLPQSKKFINYLSIVIFATSAYVAYIALSSPEPPFKGTWIGKALIILSWILLVGLISYIKLIITSVFRRKSEKTLFHVGVVMQVGSACGAVLSFFIINFTDWLQGSKGCNE